MKEDITHAWVAVTDFLALPPTNDLGDASVVSNIELIAKHQLGNIIVGWYLDNVRNYFLQVVAPRFWGHFNGENKDENDKQRDRSVSLIEAVAAVCEAVQQVDHVLNQLTNIITSIDPHPLRKESEITPREILRVVLFTEENSRMLFHEILFWFFLEHFENFNKHQSFDLDQSTDSLNLSMEEKKESHNAPFIELCGKLHYLDLILISEEIFTEILFDQIEKYIATNCKGEFRQPLLVKIQKWANEVLFEWLRLVVCPDNRDPYAEDKNYQMFQQWKTRLEFNIYETFANLRILEIFDLIVDYPDSMAALTDLRLCLANTSQHALLVHSLKNSHVQRLLHPGANTSDIISQYISTIRAMRLIDPSSVILDQVGGPIRNYLRQREDTIRCIVTSFTTEEQHSDLFEEFRRGKNKLDSGDDDEDNNDENEDDASDGDDEGDSKPTSQWTPDPLAATPNKRTHRTQDTISMLVNIYGSSELFVDEYRNMLADRLIAVTDYDVDKEVRNLELLKLRFGESSLHNCEIMLKDIADSKRTNSLIHSNLLKNAPNAVEEFKVDVTIVSHLFWPTFKEENVKLPAPVEKLYEVYCKQYEHLKRPRQLTRKPHLGTVSIELEMDDGTTLTFTVSPAHAAIIYLFQDDNKSLSLDSIATQVGMTREMARKKLVYWVNNQILHEVEKDVFQLIEAGSANQRSAMPSRMADEEEPNQVASAASLMEEKLRTCEPFIINMLTVHGHLPFERIHSVLSMAVADFTATSSDLKAFMAKLIKEDKLELLASEYAIKSV